MTVHINLRERETKPNRSIYLVIIAFCNLPLIFFDKNWLASDNVLVRYLNAMRRVLQCYFLFLFIILLCFFVCIFGVFVHARVLFSILWAQLPELNHTMMMISGRIGTNFMGIVYCTGYGATGTDDTRRYTRTVS